MTNQISTVNAEVTMTSTQLSKMLKIEKKHVNAKIRDMFADEIGGWGIRPSLDSRGYVVDYYLNELHSTMFVGRWHKPFLKQLAQFWIDGRQPVQPQLPPSQSQLDCDLLNSVNNLLQSGMLLSREDLFAILGKQLPEPKVEVIHEHRIITRGVEAKEVEAKEAPWNQQEENNRIVTKMWGITEDTKFYDDDEWDY